MNEYRERSIRQKLMRGVPLTCGLIAAIACTIFVACDFVSFRRSIAADLTEQARILAVSEAPAVASGDGAGARKVLLAAIEGSHVEEAKVYARNGAVLARYQRGRPNTAESNAARGSTVAKSFLAPVIAMEPVRANGATVGAIHLMSDPDELYAYARRSAEIALLITLLSLLLSYAFASRLHRAVSRPILDLARTAFAVSLQKDYSIRATKRSSDETGYLFDRFNEMLRQIQEREQAFQGARQALEVRVDQRTRELQKQVAERKDTERALAEQTSFLNALIENAPLGILVLDAERTIKMCNPAFEKLYGYRQQDIVGRSIYDVVPSTDSSAEVAFIDAKIREGVPAHLVAQRQRSDGSPLDVEVFIAPISLDGRTVGFLGISRDITERKRAERELADRKEFLNSLIENIPVGMLVIDAESRARMCNPAFERIFGYRRQDILGQVAVDLLATPETRDEVIANRKVLMNGETVRLITRRKRRDGSAVDVEARSVPLGNGSEYHGALLLYEDIAGRTQAEVALLRAKEAAEAANRAKSEFLANMSHEIRTPMNGIIGMTELALDTELTDEQREYLVTVQSCTDSLLTVINDILDFSKIEAGKLDLEAIEFHLSDFLGDTMRTLELRAEQKNLQLAFKIEPNVPDTLVGDPARLRQVLVNLVGNAIKFTEHGEVATGVRIDSLAERDALLHFSVSDTGIGIPREKQSAIFEAFRQADGSMTRRYGGTGLGLTISSRLVGLMGGRIWVESEPGNGSCFHFTARLELPKGPAGPSRPRDPATLRDMPVLVVDDNATNRQILTKLLNHWHMKPTTAESGGRAIELLTERKNLGRKFPLILLDAQMPVMDGFTVAEYIKRNLNFRAATIIMLSSTGRNGDTARCRDLGIAAYLTRPVRQAELLETILTALGSNTATSAPESSAPHHVLPENHRPLRILVAEDNAANRLVARRLLEKCGHVVTVAEDGRKTLTTLEQQSFDIVFMDIQMPEMNGLEATRAIRKKEKVTRRHMPIVAMTAHAIKGDAERCIAAGMDGYLAKPVSSAELLKILNKIGTANSQPRLAMPAAPDHAAGSAIDVAATLGRLGGDRELFDELARVFQNECTAIIGELRDAVTRQDTRGIERTAHALKGASAQLGAIAVSQAAMELEKMARSGHLHGAAERFAALEHEVKRLSEELESLCPG